MKKDKILVGIFILFIMVGVVSCQKKDSDIQKAVQRELAINPDATAVVVTVEDGVVILKGEVKDESTSIVISSQVAGVKDVKSVVNNLALPNHFEPKIEP